MFEGPACLSMPYHAHFAAAPSSLCRMPTAVLRTSLHLHIARLLRLLSLGTLELSLERLLPVLALTMLFNVAPGSNSNVSYLPHSY